MNDDQICDLTIDTWKRWSTITTATYILTQGHEGVAKLCPIIKDYPDEDAKEYFRIEIEAAILMGASPLILRYAIEQGAVPAKVGRSFYREFSDCIEQDREDNHQYLFVIPDPLEGVAAAIMKRIEMYTDLVVCGDQRILANPGNLDIED